MKGLFVIGTDTGVGKTLVCAGLVKALYGAKKVCYWKPVQTGTIVGDDTQEVREATGIQDPDAFLEPAYRFPDAVSPYVAAEKWGKRVDLDHMIETFERKVADGYTVVIEGAGGILVPFNEKELMIDFIARTKLPVLIVGEDRVGVINQVLLTTRAAAERGIKIEGVVLTRTRGSFGNASCINMFAGVQVLAEVPPIQDRHSMVAYIGGHERLRKLVGVPALPR